MIHILLYGRRESWPHLGSDPRRNVVGLKIGTRCKSLLSLSCKNQGINLSSTQALYDLHSRPVESIHGHFNRLIQDHRDLIVVEV